MSMSPPADPLGWRVRVFWPDDAEWFEGVVKQWHSTARTVFVVYGTLHRDLNAPRLKSPRSLKCHR